MSTSRVPPETITKSPEYRTYYSTNVFAGADPGDTRIIFYFSRLIPGLIHGQPGGMQVERIEHELQCEVHMSPAALKAMVGFLLQNIGRLENVIGPIKLGPEQPPSATPPGAQPR